MKKMSGFMMKTLLAMAVVLAAFSFLPETAEAATPKMDRTKVTWSSTKKSVVTVSKKDVVVTKKAGKATIKAKVGSKTVKCKVTVKKSAKQPWRVVTNKTLHVGESFLLIEGWFTDYESVFSYNDRIATADGSGRVTATGVGTVKILVNRGQDSKGNYRDYFCTVTVVPGAATACKHNWMDARDNKGSLLEIKNFREEGFISCSTCGNKYFDENDLFKHRESTGYSHAGSMTAGGGNGSTYCKFNKNTYCSQCGLEK